MRTRTLIVLGLAAFAFCLLVVEACEAHKSGSVSHKHKRTHLPFAQKVHRRAIGCEKDTCVGPVFLSFSTLGCSGTPTGYTQVVNNEEDYGQCINKQRYTRFNNRIEHTVFSDDACTQLTNQPTKITYFHSCQSDTEAGTSVIYLNSANDVFDASTGPFDPVTDVPWRQTWINVYDCTSPECLAPSGEDPVEIVTHYNAAGCSAESMTGSVGFYPKYSNFSLGECAYEVPSATNIWTTCADGLLREYHFQSGCQGIPTYSIAATTGCVQTKPSQWSTRRCLITVPEYQIPGDPSSPPTLQSQPPSTTPFTPIISNIPESAVNTPSSAASLALVPAVLLASVTALFML